MASLAQKIAIRKYKAEVIDGGASDTSTSFCGRVGKTYNWPCLGALPRELGGAPDERRELFEKKADCEDSADEVVAKISEEALGFPVASCVEVMALGTCSHAMAKTHCPATCGLCDALGEPKEPKDRLNHRQAKRCG